MTSVITTGTQGPVLEATSSLPLKIKIIHCVVLNSNYLHLAWLRPTFPFGLMFHFNMQDRRLGLVLFREYPLSSLYSLSIHPITPVLCVLCVNSVSMSSSCSLGICARALPRDPDYSGPLFTLHRRSFRPLPSFSVDPIVGCPFIGHCVLPHPRVQVLTLNEPANAVFNFIFPALPQAPHLFVCISLVVVVRIKPVKMISFQTVLLVGMDIL